MKKIIAGSVVLLVLIFTAFFLQKNVIKPKPIHIHAGFQVYKDDKLLDFSDFKYMHEAPCTVDGKPLEDAHVDEQLEKAHLHDHTGDVVHVHRKDALWNDLFANIKYPIDEKAVVYIDGKRVNNFLDLEIKPYTSTVIFIGNHSDDQKYLKDAVEKEYIQKIEKKSETCSS